MVILYIEKTKADETIWFKNPIKKSTRISLVSCSFYNEIYNLVGDGLIYYDEKKFVIIIPPGYYTQNIFKRVIDALKVSDKVSIELLNTGKMMLIANQAVTLNPGLAKLLNISINLEQNSRNVINIIQPTQYALYLYCDLIDSTQVLLNNKYSQILACVELNKVGEKLTYHPNNTLYTPIKNDDYINSIRVWVTDSSGKSIDAGIYPMMMVIEII